MKKRNQAKGLLPSYRTWLKITSIFFVVLTSSLPQAIAFKKLNEGTPLLKIGFSIQNITPHPDTKNWIGGQPFDGVHDSLYVRALALNDGQNEAIIISWDLVDAGESATDEVRKAISSQLSIPLKHILVNAVHNHSAPWCPVYQEGYRGKERDTHWALINLSPQNDEPHFKEWMGRLIRQTAKAARQAHETMQTATLWIGRSEVSEYLYNRRPRIPKWGIEESNGLMGGATYGPMDRTMTLISFRDRAGKNIASIYHLSCHAVSIYEHSKAISGDWPAEANKRIADAIGGSVFFLQGTAGDITPRRRGREGAIEMGMGLAHYAKMAYQTSARLASGPIDVHSIITQLPLNEKGKNRTGLNSVKAEVQLITLGSLALVTLPGEPLTDLGTAIRKASPFPQTLVLGYSNGNGVHYVGMRGEISRGGYEMNSTIGTDDAGEVLVNAAIKLLQDNVPAK